MPRPLFVFFVLISLFGLAGCPDTPANSPGRELSETDQRFLKLYDNVIEPEGLKLTLGRNGEVESDALLMERARRSEAIVRVVVQTVTANIEGESAVYRITLRTLERIAGRWTPPEFITISVDRQNESFSAVRQLDTRMVGVKLVAILRRVRTGEAEQEVRGRFVLDDEDHIRAVRSAVSVADLH